MAITKLREIIESGGYNVKNVQSLPVTPKIDAKELQAAFDQNVDTLINAIDDTGGFIDSISEYVEDVASSIIDPSGSNAFMTQAVFANGAGASSEHPVDKALYSNRVSARVSGETLYIGE